MLDDVSQIPETTEALVQAPTSLRLDARQPALAFTQPPSNIFLPSRTMLSLTQLLNAAPAPTPASPLTGRSPRNAHDFPLELNSPLPSLRTAFPPVIPRLDSPTSDAYALPAVRTLFPRAFASSGAPAAVQPSGAQAQLNSSFTILPTILEPPGDPFSTAPTLRSVLRPIPADLVPRGAWARSSAALRLHGPLRVTPRAMALGVSSLPPTSAAEAFHAEQQVPPGGANTELYAYTIPPPWDARLCLSPMENASSRDSDAGAYIPQYCDDEGADQEMALDLDEDSDQDAEPPYMYIDEDAGTRLCAVCSLDRGFDDAKCACADEDMDYADEDGAPIFDRPNADATLLHRAFDAEFSGVPALLFPAFDWGVHCGD
ncbi:hypothetical protein B0H17DRAFT_1202868 [Mycena rosella]|uniref:Uncharacterized protein n=1 Tax=Mycena rosella TaxID=1033263 RepID=A0AAD7GHS0_MYCRO|nr:hypothetical protein B0H17DRAFT_1202868 [Mycena rosella]